ncbi:hypothetical protein PIB30_048669 [Stylosanthes scabra]|uniref:Uncharacterized protein n=1 Tax=Stylosanthes scabra TaxID=79078 RepID=A0ABU6ZFU4_9FABA|nr:hypothetical protein [Stylosanthes scabra]
MNNVDDYVDEDATSDAMDLDQYRINFSKDIGKIDFGSISQENIYQFHFSDLGMAFEFYNSFAKWRGFSVRKGTTLMNAAVGDAQMNSTETTKTRRRDEPKEGEGSGAAMEDLQF